MLEGIRLGRTRKASTIFGILKYIKKYMLDFSVIRLYLQNIFPCVNKSLAVSRNRMKQEHYITFKDFSMSELRQNLGILCLQNL